MYGVITTFCCAGYRNGIAVGNFGQKMGIMTEEELEAVPVSEKGAEHPRVKLMFERYNLSPTSTSLIQKTNKI